MQYNIVHTHSGLAILLRHMLSPSKGIDIILLGRWRRWRKARGNSADSLGKVVGGGLPVIVDGEVVGGIGVSSGTPVQDREVAQAGLDAFQSAPD